jgi:phage shock protein A
LAAGHSPSLLQSLGLAPELVLICLPSPTEPTPEQSIHSPVSLAVTPPQDHSIIQEILSPHPPNGTSFINSRTQNYLIPLSDSEDDRPKRKKSPEASNWVKTKLMEKEMELLKLRQRLESRLKNNDSSNSLLKQQLDKLEQESNKKRENLTAVQGFKEKLLSQFKAARQKMVDNGLQVQLKRQEVNDLSSKLAQAEKSLNQTLEIGQQLSVMVTTLEDHLNQQDDQANQLNKELDSLKEKIASMKQELASSDISHSVATSVENESIPSSSTTSTTELFIQSENRIFRKKDFCLPSDIFSQKKPQLADSVNEMIPKSDVTTFKPFESVVGLFKKGSSEAMQKLCANEILSVCKDPKCRWAHFKGSKFKCNYN